MFLVYIFRTEKTALKMFGLPIDGKFKSGCNNQYARCKQNTAVIYSVGNRIYVYNRIEPIMRVLKPNNNDCNV